MTLAEFFTATAQLSGLLFVITSMLAMRMSLSLAQIFQPLKNARLVVLALLAYFVLVPLLAHVITLVIPLEQSLQIGLIVLATAAGAPNASAGVSKQWNLIPMKPPMNHRSLMR